jgi:hypothetical protein
MPGFHDCVKRAWDMHVPTHHNPMAVLHIKLSRVAKDLRQWSKSLVSHGKLVHAICREVIGQLEKAQESRAITEQERKLIQDLKLRILGLAAIEKCKARERPRVTWLKKEDANTKFFHIMTNVRKRKKFIHSLQSDIGVAVSQEDKHTVIFNHFL